MPNAKTKTAQKLNFTAPDAAKKAALKAKQALARKAALKAKRLKPAPLTGKPITSSDTVAPTSDVKPVDTSEPVQAAKPPKADKAAERQALAAHIAEQNKTAGDVFAQLSGAVSIPVKSMQAFKRSYKRDISPHTIGRKPSPRQAAALYVALTAANVPLADGASFPRQFELRGSTYAIENGALSDALASGLCTYDTASETITLRNASELQSQIKTAGFAI